jgi:hypothetical protein
MASGSVILQPSKMAAVANPDDSYTENQASLQKKITKAFKKKRGSGQSKKGSELAKKDSMKSIDIETNKAVQQLDNELKTEIDRLAEEDAVAIEI